MASSSSAGSGRAREVIDAYDDLLSSRAQETGDVLTSGIEKRKLAFAGRPICNVLRPLFLDRRRFEETMAATTLVARALDVLLQRVKSDLAMRELLRLTPMSQAPFLFEPPTGRPLKGRIDGFLPTAGPIKFIEYNTGPFGIAFTDMIADVFEEMPVMAEIRKRFSISHPSTMDVGFAAFDRSYGRVSVGFLATDEQIEVSKVAREMEAIVAILGSKGVRIVRGHTELDAEHRDGKLWICGEPVDLITTDTIPRFDGPIISAIVAGDARFVDGAANLMLLGTKSVFALLSDPAHHEMHAPEVRAALATHIPWTRALVDGATTLPDGTTGDLLEYIDRHRSNLVLKPTEGWGGAGIVLGWSCTDEEWAKAARPSEEKAYVVQERVEVPQSLWPHWDGKSLTMVERYTDLNPYIWNVERPGGAFIRLSPTGLLNMTAGAGSMTPLYVVDE